MTSKGWGMFSSLSTDSAMKQRLRPWYHSSVLLTNLMRKGCKIIDTDANNPEVDNTFRSMGVVGHNATYAGVVAVNRGMMPVTKTFRFSEEFLANAINPNRIYVYIYNEADLKIGEDGFVKENQILELSLKDEIEISVPQNSMVILSNKEL